MKRVFVLFSTIIICMMASGATRQRLVGNIYYYLNHKERTAQVADFPMNKEGESIGSYSGDIVIPSYIKVNNKQYCVTSIDYGAFSFSRHLYSVTIPPTIQEIGKDAFWACDSLRKVNITDIGAWCAITFYNNPLFYADLYINDTMVTDLVIPDTIKIIANYAFRNCRKIQTVSLPENLSKIGEGTFMGCSSLYSINIPSQVKVIEPYAFERCGKLAEIHIQSISDWCQIDYTKSMCGRPFRHPHNLYLNGELVTDLVIPEGVEEIKDDAFIWCTSIQTIAIPSSVKKIGKRAFYGCKKVDEVTIPKTVRQIGEGAFYKIHYVNYRGMATGSPWGADYHATTEE